MPSRSSRGGGGVGGRGVVATASYEARRFGVRSALPTAEARARCPHAAFLSGRFEVYRATSAVVMAQLRAFSPLVEPLSLDEAYVDLAASADYTSTLSTRDLSKIADSLRQRVRDATGGLTASVGIASSKLVAKIASELDKPDGAVVVPPGTEQELLRPMSVSVIPGVGPATAEKLRRIGVNTVAELEQVSSEELVRLLGQSHGTSMFGLARAQDDRPVISDRETKSISTEDTFERDVVDPTLLAAIVDRHAHSVCARLAKARLSGRTVTLKVKLHDFTTQSRSVTLAGPTDRPLLISRLARELLAQLDTSGGVRLLGVGVSGLADWVQDDLFDATDESVAVDRVDRASAKEADQVHDGVTSDSAGSAAGRATRDLGHRSWPPGCDVEHPEYGPGWVWGAGLGRVTVRFETADTGPGPVRTLRSDDPALRRRDMSVSVLDGEQPQQPAPKPASLT
ncbi:MAG: DNA polymerase IV [Nocardioidaceae bacterium]